MKFSIVALLGIAAVAYAQEPDVAAPGGEIVADIPVAEADAPETAEVDPATLYKGPIGFPPGISKPKPPMMPKFGPPKGMPKGKGGLPIWHPPHHGIDIDDCDDKGNKKWHWAHPKGKGMKPMIPHHKWTTSTITATKTKTVIDCPDHIKGCFPDKKTKFVTTTVEVTTTICPVPVTDLPKPHPHPGKPYPPKPFPPKPEGPKPTMPVYPPKPEAPKPEPPAVFPPGPEAPPAVTEAPAPDVSAPPPPPPPAVTAGAAKIAGGALAAVAAAAMLI